MKSSSHDSNWMQDVRSRVQASARAAEKMDFEALLGVSRVISKVLTTGGTVFAAGNGGSGAQAQHLVGELVGRFTAERPGLRAIVLGTDAVTTSAIGNDYGHHEIFARQLLALAQAGDVLIAFSTSGASPNLVEASRRARQAGLSVVSFVGNPESHLAENSDCFFSVANQPTPIVQEVHLVAIHLLCQIVERDLGWGG